MMGLAEESLETQNVVGQFQELINVWCQHHCGCKKCRKNELDCECEKCQSMCKKAVDKFSPYFSASYIRDNIKGNFKIKFRSNNGFLKRLRNLDGTLQQNLYQTKLYEENKK